MATVISARNLILDLVLARHPRPCSVREFIVAGQVFAMSENSMRVAVARLAQQGLVHSAGRGLYRMGVAAVSLAQEVGAWRQAEKRMRNWGGDYWMIYTADLGRSDRTQLRAMGRALSLAGFREWRRGLYVRPDNLRDDLDALRARLCALGLPPEALCLRLDGAVVPTAEVQVLWPLADLQRQYREQSERLRAWRLQETAATLAEAARESFCLGDAAIRAVVFDPLLPMAWVDAAQRQNFFAEVRAFDAHGRGIWERYFEQALPGRS